MLSAFLLSMPEKPTVEQTTVFYRDSMMTGQMKLFCRMSRKKKFSDVEIEGMRKAAARL